jgi:hypothetical protein
MTCIAAGAHRTRAHAVDRSLCRQRSSLRRGGLCHDRSLTACAALPFPLLTAQIRAGPTMRFGSEPSRRIDLTGMLDARAFCMPCGLEHRWGWANIGPEIYHEGANLAYPFFLVHGFLSKCHLSLPNLYEYMDWLLIGYRGEYFFWRRQDHRGSEGYSSARPAALLLL